jgi:hypothetical protein
MHNLEWFTSRIGKRIYRNAIVDKKIKKECCPTCMKVAREGLIVMDKMHAEYLFDTEADFGADGYVINYRDKL